MFFKQICFNIVKAIFKIPRRGFPIETASTLKQKRTRNYYSYLHGLSHSSSGFEKISWILFVPVFVIFISVLLSQTSFSLSHSFSLFHSFFLLFTLKCCSIQSFNFYLQLINIVEFITRIFQALSIWMVHHSSERWSKNC